MSTGYKQLPPTTSFPEKEATSKGTEELTRSAGFGCASMREKDEFYGSLNGADSETLTGM